ncbi:MAG: hypothetical protein WBG11_03845, partial [Methylocella sp.]
FRAPTLFGRATTEKGSRRAIFFALHARNSGSARPDAQIAASGRQSGEALTPSPEFEISIGPNGLAPPLGSRGTAKPFIEKIS